MWDERYSDAEYVYGTDPNDFLVEQADRLPQGRVLCLAEGEGRNAVWLAQRGFAVTAVDSSAVGLEKARRLAAERSVSIETLCTDLDDYTLEPGQWAGVVSIFAHVPPDVRRTLHARVVQGLVPGGALILEAYTPHQLGYGTGGPSAAEMTMDLLRLEEELAGLEFEFARECEREVVEGKYHTGRGHVVQLVGRKPLA